MRLIDESSVIENIEEWIDSVGDVVIGKGLSSYAELMGCIEEAPTVEAEPVRHGHWINSDYIGVDMPVVCCSVCEIRFCDVINNHRYMYHYCPNCGAKMDEEEDR